MKSILCWSGSSAPLRTRSIWWGAPELAGGRSLIVEVSSRCDRPEAGLLLFRCELRVSIYATHDLLLQLVGGFLVKAPYGGELRLSLPFTAQLHQDLGAQVMNARTFRSECA